MANSIAALKHLKALRLVDSRIVEKTASPLSQLSGLKHITFQAGMLSDLVSGPQKVLQTILARSLSTLISLDVRAFGYSSNFLERFEDRIEEHDPDALEQPHYFTALKSVTLIGHCWEGERALLWTDLNKSIDFLQLRELRFIQLGKGNVILFKHLEDLFSKADEGSIQLRRLSVDLDADKSSPVASEEHLESIYRFLASFDTLASLNVLEHNVFTRSHLPQRRFPNPGLSRKLQQAIINHKHLESLRFKYRGHPPYYVSAEVIETFTKSLPRLQVLEIAPKDDDLVSSYLLLFSFLPSQSLSSEEITFSHSHRMLSHDQSRRPKIFEPSSSELSQVG